MVSRRSFRSLLNHRGVVSTGSTTRDGSSGVEVAQQVAEKPAPICAITVFIATRTAGPAADVTGSLARTVSEIARWVPPSASESS